MNSRYRSAYFASKRNEEENHNQLNAQAEQNKEKSNSNELKYPQNLTIMSMQDKNRFFFSKCM